MAWIVVESYENRLLVGWLNCFSEFVPGFERILEFILGFQIVESAGFTQIIYFGPFFLAF